MSAAEVAEALAGGRRVKKHGDNYLVNCPTHEDASPSLSLCDGERGLIVHCFAGCDPADIYAAIRRLNAQLLEPGVTASQPANGTAEYARRQHEKADWLWAQRRPIGGTIAERYLRDARGITCLLPPTLAFLPPIKREHHPAMVAAFAISDEPEPGRLGQPRDVASVHLTLLKPDGSGKADAKPNKISIGSPVGRPIVLAPPNDLLGLAITEGIEDGLTAHWATGLGAWASASAPHMPSLAAAVPAYIETVTIFAHNDGGLPHAKQLATRLRAKDIEVTIEVSP